MLGMGITSAHATRRCSHFRTALHAHVVIPDRKMRFARDVTTGGSAPCPNSCFPGVSLPNKTYSLPDSSRSHDGSVTTETSQRRFYDPDRSRVCDCPGSLARDLQNHGNPALTTGWYVSYPRFTGARLILTHFSVKVGYPPKSLTLIPELPISSLGLSKGEQLIVNQNGRGQSTKSTSTTSATGPSVPGVVQHPSARPLAPAQPPANEPDSVETEGSYLVHRVRSHPAPTSHVTEGNG